VAELAATSPWQGLGLPVAVGTARLDARPLAGLVSIAPFRGQAEAVAHLLGTGLPSAGGSAEGTGGRVLWFRLGQWMAEGPAVGSLAATLGEAAAVTDQTDGWAVLTLEGPGAAEVLARLVPIDLEPGVFPVGQVARTPLRHIPALLIRTAAGFEIWVMRSFTASAVHDLRGAMERVAATAAVPGR